MGRPGVLGRTRWPHRSVSHRCPAEIVSTAIGQNHRAHVLFWRSEAEAFRDCVCNCESCRERFRRAFELVDLCRVDHFRGFVSYWSVPAKHKTALRGRWRPGPGLELFDAVKAEHGSLPLIAEDLGRITPPVYALRDELGLPGMAVLLLASRGSPRNPHRPENHVRNEVVYTSTHDTDTVAGFFGGEPSNWELIELAYSSRASLAIVPAQDVLGLGSEARMNRPGTAKGNWQWRLASGQLTPALARRMRELAERYRR